ncbi:helix-turn-helix domain-containing protein [Mycolicibacter senuensis]|uniref:helix-turn-helix domain-containing protein n=1 Tax=Mycolicibacter senuensis TaxID=386913 RepID=UPI0014026C56|nr:helix-turn-helix domain-containing protein [Mycolicibacter senuensis]
MRSCKNTTTQAQLGVVGRAGSTSAFDLTRWAPTPPNDEFVEHFWSVRWDLRGRDPHDNAVITFPAVHLTHEWGTDQLRHGHRLPATLVHGVVTRVFQTRISGCGAVVGARFRPGGYAARFGRDAGAVTDKVVAAHTELAGEPWVLDEDVAAVSAALDGLIAAAAPEPDRTYRALRTLVDRIRDDDGLRRVEQVMDISPWSTRTTQRVFRRYVGVPVKWVLCRYRLQQAALEIETRPATDFADLAVRLGWYDQPHFVNDFRLMLGCTPGEYAARYGA